MPESGLTVSMVKRCHQTETHPITFDEIWDAVRTGAHGLKEKISQIRNRYEAEKDITGDVAKAKKAVADLKLELPGFLPSGTFTKRENNALVEYSAILCADLDSLGERLTPIRNTLRDMPFVRAIALSPSGDGLKVFINVINDPLRHEDSFRNIKIGIRESLDVEIDEKCKDLARICFFTYDPDLWVRIDGNEIFPPADPLPRGRTSAVPPPTSADVNMTRREQISFTLLGELRQAPEKNGYFVTCPGVSFHSNKSGEKHTILYLDTVPTLSCQHQSCAHVVEAFNKVLRSEIGKAEYKQAPGAQRDPFGANGEIPVEEEKVVDEWADALGKAFVSSRELEGLTIVPRKKIMADWFREGDLGYIFGFRGVAKTWFALGLSTALSTGGKIGEWQAHAACQVAYLDSEMPAEDIRARVIGLGLTANDNFHLLNHELLFERTGKVVNVNNITIQKAITRYCVENKIQVFVVDNLSTAAYGMRENEADSWEQMNRWLLELRREKISVVIIHHAGRAGNMRGTSKREDAAFWVIQLDDAKKDSDDRNGARFISRFTKSSRNTQLDVPSYEWHFLTDFATNEVHIDCKLSEGLAVFHAVIESGVTKPSEIAKVMGIQDYQVSRFAKKAIDQGWLERASRGEYRLVEIGTK
jgi:putative DNA primase/helicase